MPLMSFPSTPPDSLIARQTPRLSISPSTLRWLVAGGLAYALLIIAATLTLNPYFAQTWDAVTFVQAGRALLDGNPFDLYAQSVASQRWPYAYPPLHAFVVALALIVGDGVRGLPDFVWARVPAILADIGVAMVLFAIVRRKSDESVARIAALAWLFNPITFYDTAVQGHFESEWLVFVLLAYLWHAEERGVIASSIALAVAVLFKQIAILFAIPIWVMMLSRMRIKNLVVSLGVFALVTGIVSLPFLLNSNDFVFMNTTYVENVPVQTQSWIVALLGWTRTAPNALTSDFILLRYQTIVSMIAATIIAFIAARREWNLYLTATLITIAFFLTSKKVMGYYYVMLLPFLFADTFTRRRFDLACIAIAATAWIALSPYYAGWTRHPHWWVYAILGTLNSAFFVWIFAQLIRTRTNTDEQRKNNLSARAALALTLGLFAASVGAALLQPFAQNTTSPIRAPIVAPGMEMQAAFAFGALGVVIALALAGTWYVTRGEERVPKIVWALPFIVAPLFFAVYYLTKETTAIFEIALQVLGV
jgi:hypothetical protein